MEQEQKRGQEDTLNIALKAEAYRDGLGHFQLKLGMIQLDMPIEEQLEVLSDYNNIPDLEAIKRGDTQLSSGYINDFFEKQVEKYFQEYPHALDVLGKRFDNALENYAALGIKYRLLRGDNVDKDFRQQSRDAYYDYLTKYAEWLLNHIHNNQAYSLTKSTSESFEVFYRLYNNHSSIVKTYSDPTSLGTLINKSMEELFPVIKTLKAMGLSDYLYEFSVSNMIINKYKALSYFIIHMAGGGEMVIQALLPKVTEPLGIDGIYSKLCQAETELELTDVQRQTLADVKVGLEALRKKYGSSSNGGCFGMLLFLLSAGASGLAMMFAFIL